MSRLAAPRGRSLGRGGSSVGRFLLKADLAETDSRLRALRSPVSSDAPPSSELLARAVESVTGLEVRRMDAEAARGTFRWVVPTELSNGCHVMVRVNRLDHGALVDGLAMEARLLRHLRAIGLAVPAVLAVDTSRRVIPFAFGVVERLDGPTLADRDDDDAATDLALRSLGRYLRELHSICLVGAGPLAVVADRGGLADLAGTEEQWPDYVVQRLEEHLAGLVAAGQVAAATAEWIDRALRAGRFDDTADRLLHGDPGGPNVILDRHGGIAGLVDWEDALVGDPIFELASAAAFQPERRWPSLFEGYRFAPSGERGRRFWLYFLRIVVARTVVRQRFGIVDQPGRPPAAGRIARAIEALGGPSPEAT